MDVTIKKWGNSNAIRIPQNVIKELGITENDTLELEVIDGKIIISKSFKHVSLKERIDTYGKDFDFYQYNWDEARGREEF